MSRTKNTNVKGFLKGNFFSTIGKNFHLARYGPNVDELALSLAERLESALEVKPKRVRVKKTNPKEFEKLLKTDSEKAMEYAFPSDLMAQIARKEAINQLLRVLKNAFATGDASFLKKLADAIEAIKHGPVDPVRMKMLFRQWCAHGKPQVTMRVLHDWLKSEGYSGNVRQVRRMASEIGFPIAAGKKGRPNKSDN